MSDDSSRIYIGRRSSAPPVATVVNVEVGVDMERGVVIGGLLVGVSMLLAAVLNSYANRDAVAMPHTPRVVLPEYDKATHHADVTGAGQSLQAVIPATSTTLEQNGDSSRQPDDLTRLP